MNCGMGNLQYIYLNNEIQLNKSTGDGFKIITEQKQPVSEYPGNEFIQIWKTGKITLICILNSLLNVWNLIVKSWLISESSLKLFYAVSTQQMTERKYLQARIIKTLCCRMTIKWNEKIILLFCLWQ